MPHWIRGFIVRADDLAEIQIEIPSVRAVPLRQGLSFVPLIESLASAIAARFGDTSHPGFEMNPHVFLRPEDVAFARQIARTSTISYIETEYHGGTGWQFAITWVGGQLAQPAAFHEGKWHDCVDVGPINQALRYFGVQSEPPRDRFDAVGFSDFRGMDEFERIDSAYYDPSYLARREYVRQRKQSVQVEYKPAGACPKCGYQFDGGVCPECGEFTLRKQLRPLNQPRGSWKPVLFTLLAFGLWWGGSALHSHYPTRRFWPNSWLLADCSSRESQAEFYTRMEGKFAPDGRAFLEAVFPQLALRGNVQEIDGQAVVRAFVETTSSGLAPPTAWGWTVAPRNQTVLVSGVALGEPENTPAFDSPYRVWGPFGWDPVRVLPEPIDDIQFPLQIEVRISFDLLDPAGTVLQTFERSVSATAVDWGVPMDSQRK